MFGLVGWRAASLLVGSQAEVDFGWVVALTLVWFGTEDNGDLICSILSANSLL